jgi:PadR family transcriptional regulator
MADREFLGEFEQLLLLAVMRLGRHAYGVSIRREIEERTGRAVSRGSVYISLERLETKGYLRSRVSEPTRERGGRAKRLFEVSRAGVAALRESRRSLHQMWNGLEPVLGEL